MALGDYGDFRDEFFFDHRELFHYRRNGMQREVATDSEGASRLVEVSLPNTALSIPAYYVVAPAECSSNLSRYDGSSVR